jgi:hypothetical protein
LRTNETRAKKQGKRQKEEREFGPCRKKLGGNADRCEKKGVAKKGIQKMLKIRE